MAEQQTNFLITGEKGIGKSTLLNEIVEVLGIQASLAGFQTLPYYEKDKRKGFYMHSLKEMKANDQPISIQYTEDTCECIPETFETLGVAILRQCIATDGTSYLLFDEIGTLESKCTTFTSLVGQCLDKKQCVIGVIKEKEHPFIQSMTQRQDTKIYQLTKDNRAAIRSAFIADIQSYIKGV